MANHSTFQTNRSFLHVMNSKTEVKVFELQPCGAIFLRDSLNEALAEHRMAHGAELPIRLGVPQHHAYSFYYVNDKKYKGEGKRDKVRLSPR